VEKKEEAKPLEPRTGREAFQSMYVAARGWQHDATPMQLKSIPLTAVKADSGKSGAWQAIFVSPAAGRARTFTWCAIEMEGNLHKGVFAGPDESWSGPSGRQPALRGHRAEGGYGRRFENSACEERLCEAAFECADDIPAGTKPALPRPLMAHSVGRQHRHQRLFRLCGRHHRRPPGQREGLSKPPIS
jgi:hypothetical protein